MEFGAGQPQPTTDPGAGEGEGQGNEFYQSLLSDIPEEHRPYVEEAVKKFDGEVTRKFQDAADYRKQWEPYEELGINNLDPEAVQGLMAFAEIANDPDTFRQWWESVGDEYGFMDDDDDDDLDDDDDTLTQEKVDQLVESRLQEMLSPLLQREQSREEEERMQAAEEAIDDQFAQLEQQYGELSDDQKRNVIQLALAYQDDAENAILRGFQDYQGLISSTEREALSEKANQPKPAGGEGKANTNAKPVTSFEDAASMAKERLAQG